MSRSVSASPLRKRPRLSSPTYDSHFSDLDSDDFQALDDIEAKLSQEANQNVSSYSEYQNDLSIVLNDEHNARRMECIDPYPQNPSCLTSNCASTASLRLTAMKDSTTAPAAQPTSPLARSLTSPSAWTRSPGNHIEVTSRLAASGASSVTDFAAASALNLDVPMLKAFAFHHASGKTWASPSSSALEAAKAKLNIWEAEIESDLLNWDHATKVTEKVTENELLGPHRAPLKDVENSPAPPPPEVVPEISSVSTISDSHLNFTKPFKAPAFTTPLQNRQSYSRLINSNFVQTMSSTAPNTTIQGSTRLSSSTPSTRLHSSVTTHSQVSSPRPPLGSKFTTPRSTTWSQASGYASHVAKPLGLTPRAHAFTGSNLRPKFVTPFKGRIAAEEQEFLVPAFQLATNSKEGEGKSREAIVLPQKMDKVDAGRQEFVLAKISNPKNLVDCGLTPQNLTKDELIRMGFDAELFNLTSVVQFLYYRFDPAGAGIPDKGHLPAEKSLGPDSALAVLVARGCNRATKQWVDNHWPLILWKMLGMSCLNPAALSKQWCWREVIRQLRYRYTREVANGVRPALRLITTHDAPASSPLVLCVSDVFWTDEYLNASGQVVLAHPELELTDGWYRLRATVDEALARATRNKILRVGRKIACCGAKLVSVKKDPMEVIDAYGSMHLLLHGNSTHLAPWHAKLGFQPLPFVATLRSLSPDGGNVPLMDLLVTKVLPVGYIEYITMENGEQIREGPRNEREEAQEEDKWKERRSQEALRLREELEKKYHLLEECADRLQRVAGSEFKLIDDESPPDGIEDLVEELENSENPASFLKCVNKKDAGWLSQSLRKKCKIDREMVLDEIDGELASSFPPRQVRNFRVLRVRDARTVRKASTRTAQLTVWDVMSLNTTEGGSAGSFAEGQRYMVTNLVASQPSAWMGLEPGSEVFLTTRRDSKWKMIR